jgi:hypothetical protein
VDDLAGDAAFGEASGVGAVEVVVPEVVLEVFGERGQLRYERAGEAGPPAFLEDRLLEPLDVAVRRWPARADAALFYAEPLEYAGEGAGAKRSRCR